METGITKYYDIYLDGPSSAPVGGGMSIDKAKEFAVSFKSSQSDNVDGFMDMFLQSSQSTLPVEQPTTQQPVVSADIEKMGYEYSIAIHGLDNDMQYERGYSCNGYIKGFQDAMHEFRNQPAQPIEGSGVDEDKIQALYDTFANWYMDDGSYDTFLQSEAYKAIIEFSKTLLPMYAGYGKEEIRGFTKYLLKQWKPVKGGWQHRGDFYGNDKPKRIELIMEDYISTLPTPSIPPVSSDNDGWVSVEDRLPDSEGSYLAWVTKHNYLGPKQGVFVVYYGFANDEDAEEMFWLYRMESIELSHWMPLPPHPNTNL